MENMWDNSISSARYFMARYIIWSFSPNDSIYLQPCPINAWFVTLKYALMLTWKFWCLSNRNVISATFWKLFSVIVTTQILKRADVKCEMWINVKQCETNGESMRTRRDTTTFFFHIARSKVSRLVSSSMALHDARDARVVTDGWPF